MVPSRAPEQRSLTNALSSSGTLRKTGWLLALVVLCLLRFGTAAAFEPTPRNEPRSAYDALLHLEIAIFDGVSLSESALGTIRDELEQTFRSIGVHVSWVDREASPRARVQSLEFRVHIMPIQPTTWGFRPRAMGAVLSLPPPHSVYVFFPTIVRTVNKLDDSHYGRLGSDSRLVARGIARVIAHEMLHVLAPGLPHAREGIMKRAFDRNDLLLRRPFVDPAFAAASRRHLVAANSLRWLLLGAPSGPPPGRNQ
jgi:hypothetical protein